MLLRDWLPHDNNITDEDSVFKFLNWNVVEDFNLENEHPFRHKHIYNWCIVTDGKKHYAIGWNENQSIGWSYPVKRIYNYEDGNFTIKKLKGRI